MASLARGDSSSSTNPILDIYTAIGVIPGLVDITGILEFRILDISTPAKKVTPFQVFPVAVGTFEPLDPSTAPPTGHRLGLGHYFAPWTVPLDEPIGDHKIEWNFTLDALSPTEQLIEEFFVSGSLNPTAGIYCGIGDIRAEGFTDTVAFPDSRILALAKLATLYIDKMTGRYFTPRTFDTANPMLEDGRGGSILQLQIPIIRLDKLEIDYEGTLGNNFSEVDLGELRAYNRHLSGHINPDDRENPRISFRHSGRRYQRTIRSCFGSYGHFIEGYQNIRIEGVFGYTDPDGSPFGQTPCLISQIACLLIIRELRQEIDACEKFNDLNRWRINFDKEGSTTVKLQELWLKGAFTGDSRIDNILMAFKRPIDIAAI